MEQDANNHSPAELSLNRIKGDIHAPIRRSCAVAIALQAADELAKLGSIEAEVESITDRIEELNNIDELTDDVSSELLRAHHARRSMVKAMKKQGRRAEGYKHLSSVLVPLASKE